jgi:hypothetical protein
MRKQPPFIEDDEEERLVQRHPITGRVGIRT